MKITEGKHQGKGGADLRGFWLKMGVFIGHHLGVGAGWGTQSDIEGDRIWRVEGSG